MSIKRLAPEAIETFSVVLHPKRRYRARASYLVGNTESSDLGVVPSGALASEADDALITQDDEYLVEES